MVISVMNVSFYFKMLLTKIKTASFVMRVSSNISSVTNTVHIKIDSTIRL